jgi:DNA adenine methylase
MRTLPLLSWPGGKSRHLKRLLPHIPAGAGYIEAFAGGCALLLAKPQSRLEVVNDINGDLINLYRCAANHPDELARKLRELPPASRAQIDHTRQLLRTTGCLTDIQRAALFLHLNKTSFAGSGTSLAVVRNPAGRAFMGTESLIERVRTFQARFNSVVIEHLDYQRLLKVYDHQDNFIFLDPPYGISNIRNYDGWTDEQLANFRDRVVLLRGRWIVTIDDSPTNRSLWAGHDLDQIQTRNGSGNQAVGPTRHFGELIIYSPGLRG